MQLLQHFKEFSLHPKNAQELKGFILQLALRGFLTKKVNRTSIQIYKDKVKGYYKLPDGWYWDKFDDLADFQMGKTPPSKETQYWDGGIPWVSIADMSTYTTVSKTKKTISDLGLKNYFKNTLIKKGTLIMSFKLSIGKTSILGFDACHNEAIISVYPKNMILQEYLFLFLPIISNWGVQVSALMGNTLNKGKIQNLKVPVPPLKEQKAIVEVVNQLFDEVEQLEELTKQRIHLKSDFVTSALRQLTTGDTQKEWAFLQQHFSTFFTEKPNVEKLRESILQLAVQGKLTKSWRKENPNTEDALVLLERIKVEKAQLVKDKKIKKEKPLPPIPEDEIPYELPEGWGWCRLGDFGELYGGSTPSKARSDYWDGNIPWVSSRDMKSIEISRTELGITKLGQTENRNRIVPVNSILMVTRSGILKRHFPVSINVIPCTVNQDLKVLTPVLHDLGSYIRLMLHGHEQIILTELVKGGTTVQSIEFDKLLARPFPYPPLAEQKAIVQKVNALMGLCDELGQQIEKGKTAQENWMKSALREVFSPRETKDELLSSLLPELDSLHKVANLQQAMIVQKTELDLGSGRGKVYLQKTSANLKNIKKAAIAYNFEKSHHGEFSWQLSEDLDKNPYLLKVTTDYGEIYKVKPERQQEVLKALNSPDHFSFVEALNELIEVYKNKFINGATDRVELLNTVCKAITDTQSTLGNTIYGYMQEWEIRQKGFKTKADKFTQSETFAMIQLVVQLGWDKELISYG